MLLVQRKCGHRDATQKLTGNGKDLHILIVISIGGSDSSRVISNFLMSMEELMS